MAISSRAMDDLKKEIEDEHKLIDTKVKELTAAELSLDLKKRSVQELEGKMTKLKDLKRDIQLLQDEMTTTQSVINETRGRLQQSENDLRKVQTELQTVLKKT